MDILFPIPFFFFLFWTCIAGTACRLLVCFNLPCFAKSTFYGLCQLIISVKTTCEGTNYTSKHTHTHTHIHPSQANLDSPTTVRAP